MNILNKKLIIFSLIIFLLSFFVVQKTNAAPNISVVTGNLTNNSNVTVEGNAFGIKISNQALPLRFETWGSGNEGKTAQEASSGWWSDGIATIFPKVVSSNKRIETRDVLDATIYPDSNSTSEASISRTFYKKQAGFDQTSKMLLNFWIYTDLSNNQLNENIDTQLKFIHVSSDVFSTWPWGYTNFVMPFRAMSFWESMLPDNSSSTMTSYEPLALGATGLRNDLNNTRNIFKSEGWYNIQIELDQGEYGVRGSKEKISITGPNYAKYGTWSNIDATKSAYIDYPQWQANVPSGWVVWHQGKRYAAKTSGINTAISPDQDPDNWHESYPTDKLNSVIFWLWSQKRGSNQWNFSNQTLLISGSIYQNVYYEIVQQGTSDFTTMGAADNNAGTIFQSNKYAVMGNGDQLRRVDSYKIGSKADYNGKAYRCISDVISLVSPEQDNVHWEKIFDYPWPSSTIKMFFDSIYIDNSFARVEIGDNPIYDNCTHREIQPTEIWSDNQIQFTLNQGSFSDGQAYLFVIDENGNPSVGKEIIIGQSEIPISYNVKNFIDLIGHWSYFGVSNILDINSDNIINTRDLGIMLSKWN